MFKIAIEGKSGITGIYNLSSGINTNLETLVDTARKIFNLNSLPIWGQYETRLFDSEKWSGENLAIKKDFGWIVQTDLLQGLQMFSSWVDNTLLNKYYKV